MGDIIALPIPNTLPILFENALNRITLLEKAIGVDLIKEGYKILSHSLLILEDGNSVNIFYLGFNSRGFEPYFDVQMELAYECLGRNMNCVILNKGDDQIEVKVDGKTIGITEGISQSMVHWHDEEAYLAKKWLAFNFRSL